MAVEIAVPIVVAFLVIGGIVGWIFVAPKLRTWLAVRKQNQRGIGASSSTYGGELDNLQFEKLQSHEIHTAAGKFSVQY